jgi:hypothetical protein
MNEANALNIELTEAVKERRAAYSQDVTVFTDMYNEDTNIAIWQRDLPSELEDVFEDFLDAKPTLKAVMTVTPESVSASISELLADTPGADFLTEDISKLVDMFCYLFGLKRVGLRLTALTAAMCPRFHVDKVPCRLVTTYCGEATQWLPHNIIDRTKLGIPQTGTDLQSGLFSNNQDIQQMTAGDVALLKGEVWQGNENAGLVHRSPALKAGQRRLLLTLDFSS